MTLLITGAGLVGAQIARLEQSEGRTPLLLDIEPDTAALSDVVDLSRCVIVSGRVDDLATVRACLSDHGVTRIIHTAAHPGLTFGGEAAPLPTVQTNVVGAATVLEAARLGTIERVVLCSSSTVHISLRGGVDRGVLSREDAYPRPTTVYAATKQASEDIGRAYLSTFGLDVVVVRFPAVFGPWRAGGGGRASALVEQWIQAAMSGGPLEIDPPTLDWVYSKDAALGAHLACWTPGVGGGTFHIGMGAPQPASAFQAALTRLFPGVAVSVAPSRQAGSTALDIIPDGAAQGFALAIGRAEDQLGFRVDYPLPVALADFASWMKQEARGVIASNPER